jgi:hypothetical protein
MNPISTAHFDSDPGYRELTAEDGNLLPTDEVQYRDSGWKLATQYSLMFGGEGVSWHHIGKPIAEWLKSCQTPSPYRARRKLTSPRWIPRSERVPTEADLPVIVRYPNGHTVLAMDMDQSRAWCSDHPANFGAVWHHYDMPPLPLPPLPTQRELDEEACKGHWITITTLPYRFHPNGSLYPDGWHAALKWERARVAKGSP